ncbi:MAG TPA: hypothetical protein DEB31_07680 [Clostridiales bacterium]|nr:hypothetical protein [Clostridiales bacterium]
MSEKTPSKETIKRLREQYPVRTRVELVSMEDPYSKLRPGDRGTVSLVDDIGTIHVDWDSGSHLGIVYGVDSVKHLEKEIEYETGTAYWNHLAGKHGLAEADTICGKYFSFRSHSEQTEAEIQFCHELFAAMYENTAALADPAKLVYPYSFEKANERLETSYYHKSAERNGECAHAIDHIINASCYKTYHYNLELAAILTVQRYGFQRVNAVLARNLQAHEGDGRYSRLNKEWAQGISLTDEAFRYSYMNAHPILLEDFTKYVRALYDTVGAERFWLPGRTEAGINIKGYDITRSVWFDSQRGFAIGYDPGAPSPYVCWQFTAENGKRNFYWGTYCMDAGGAADSYIARTIVHMDGGDVREIPNPLAAAEMSEEQNYNQIDDAINNEKPSVMEQIREAREAPSAPRKEKQDRGKGGPEL